MYGHTIYLFNGMCFNRTPLSRLSPELCMYIFLPHQPHMKCSLFCIAVPHRLLIPYKDNHIRFRFDYSIHLTFSDVRIQFVTLNIFHFQYPHLPDNFHLSGFYFLFRCCYRYLTCGFNLCTFKALLKLPSPQQ